MPATILVVEDEVNIASLVCTYLRRELSAATCRLAKGEAGVTVPG
jgi:DNA-binding response OmpR family regulator